MARVNIPVTDVDFAGVLQPAATAGDATNDHYFENDGRTILQVKNTSGGALSVTFDVVLDYAGRTFPDEATSIPAGETWYFGPFARAVYGQSADSNRVWVNITSSSFEFRAFRLAA